MFDDACKEREIIKLESAKSCVKIAGEINVRSESWSGEASRFFLFRLNLRTYCGEKLLSPLVERCNSPTPFCALITQEMLLGAMLQIHTDEFGVEIYYETLSAKEYEAIFYELMHAPHTDIHFPFVYLQPNTYTEINAPEMGWKIDETIANILFQGEVYHRKISIERLQQDGHETPVIYDPACSTGDFLRAIKEAIPGAYTIGQDLSPDMCQWAKKGIDEVYCGDASTPAATLQSCDYIFFRFLNNEVVSTKKAKHLFTQIMRCLKPNGKAILFGFTPLLLTESYFKLHGYDVCQCNAAIEQEKALIQYYVIQKNQTIKEII